VQLTPDYRPEFESLRDLLLEIASERSLEVLLKKVVKEMAERPHAVLARLWLIDKGDLCTSCEMRLECPNERRCLHLEAEAGVAIGERDEDGVLRTARPTWDEAERIPLGVGVIGRVGSTGHPVVSNDPDQDLGGHGGEAWARRMGIHGFNCQPIKFHNEVLGVLAQFTRVPTPELTPAWLRIFANQIGAAIVNARAFEQIEKLKARLELENTFLQEEVREAKAFGDMIGQSKAFQQLLRQVEMVAPTDSAVLILGETGTGKELVAREIHKRSRRCDKPLIRVNCASIPKELYESEFFGHVKGAFTGALKTRAGRFEAAQGGTLFLDEVGEIPLDLQSKLLRVLQDGEYQRVGEEETRTVDVRIIAASNRNLPAEVEAGRFRQDLYYRLNVFPIEVAPLRKRKEDIPLLAAHFLEKAARKLKVPPGRLTQAHLVRFQAYDWPGNIRELQNMIERSLILARKGVLWFDFPESEKSGGKLPPLQSGGEPPPFQSAEPEILSDLEFRQREGDNILRALNKTRWKIHGPGGTAELLGVKPTTLISRIQKLGLKKAK
jgi:transcriptional regulator with GAF, ATPase, and Fis domain